MKPPSKATFDRLLAFERLTADGVPVLEAINRLSWSIQGAYMALRRVPATDSRDELRRELNRHIGAIKRQTLAETHGTSNCYAAGCRCDACRTAHADSRRRQRALVAPCGTEAAYRRHYSRGESPCDACRVAHSATNARRRVEATAAAQSQAIAETVVADLERIIRTRIAALSTVKSWEARARASELRALLAQITKKEAA